MRAHIAQTTEKVSSIIASLEQEQQARIDKNAPQSEQALAVAQRVISREEHASRKEAVDIAVANMKAMGSYVDKDTLRLSNLYVNGHLEDDEYVTLCLRLFEEQLAF